MVSIASRERVDALRNVLKETRGNGGDARWVEQAIRNRDPSDSRTSSPPAKKRDLIGGFRFLRPHCDSDGRRVA
jgi:hypothetical protein